MSLTHDLEVLRKLRAEEIHTLHLTYVRSKRTLIRTTAPSRLIRQHVAASLGIATAVGLILAPRTGSRPSPEKSSSPETQPHPSPENKHSVLRTLLKEAATLLLSKIDLKKIIALALETITHQHQPSAPEEQPHPNVSVSNAGTVHDSNIDDFQ